MGVISVQNHLPAFEFAGESSRDYGVYITDVNVFDGASRDIELVDIPGRNGAYIIDNGRFSDIAITYDCAMGADGSAGASDFADNMAAIRAWLSSVSGYARLEDDINPDEYRMAAFSGGIKVNTNGKRTGEFSIEFTAKPERYLKSGETAVTVTSGATITNPTKFSAAPLLMVDGYGDIEINEEKITIYDEPIGVLTTPNVAIRGDTFSYAVGILDAANNGDPITVNGAHIAFTAKSNADPGPSIVGVSAEQTSGDITVSTTGTVTGNYEARLRCDFGSVQFVKGTAKTETMVVAVTIAFSTIPPVTGNVNITYAYDGNKTVTVSFTPLSGNWFTEKNPEVATGRISVNSSKGSLGEPLYIDLEYGEAYKEESGTIISINNAVSLPAELPKLNPGSNEITYTNHITELQMVPRWWTI